MVVKTICMFVLLSVPIVLVILNVIHTIPILLLMYILAGFGMAGIGMGVMHDAIHGSYSRNQRLNKLVGLSLNLIGANDDVWRLQHNVLHHTYTNVKDGDDDINPPFFLRFSPHAPRYGIHRYQHWYTWIFYGLSTLSWVTTKDFIRLNRYWNMGLMKDRATYRRYLAKMVAWKVVYYTYILILPILFSSFGAGWILLAFAAMHFVTGMSMSVVFQTAHVMPSTEFHEAGDNGVLAHDRLVHQMATTCNFAPGNKLLTWCIGGLNYQVEHHLFPNICHVHYRHLSPIVKATAEEYGIPYLYKKTFTGALADHYQMLRTLGRS